MSSTCTQPEHTGMSVASPVHRAVSRNEIPREHMPPASLIDAMVKREPDSEMKFGTRNYHSHEHRSWQWS